MPHPFSKVVPNASIDLSPDALADKPDMAILVTQIFALWATIEQQQRLLLVKILGASESPAIAMYSVLTSQQLQLRALEATAKAALKSDQYAVFQALIMMADSVQTPRNHLAHWRWARCSQRPDLLGLADPQMIRDRDISSAKFNAGRQVDDDNFLEYFRELSQIYKIDPSRVLAYSKSDLERSVRDLNETVKAFTIFDFYLDPSFDTLAVKGLIRHGRMTPEYVREQTLLRLNELRLFREALDQIRAGQRSTQPMTHESPQPKPGE